MGEQKRKNEDDEIENFFHHLKLTWSVLKCIFLSVSLKVLAKSLGLYH